MQHNEAVKADQGSLSQPRFHAGWARLGTYLPTYLGRYLGTYLRETTQRLYCIRIKTEI